MKIATMLFTLLVLLVSASSAWAAPSGCSGSAVAVVYSPNTVYAVLPDQGLTLPGSTTPMVNEYQVGLFIAGVDPSLASSAPITSITVPGSDWTLEVGAIPAIPQCYFHKFTASELLAEPVGQLHQASIKVRRTMPIDAIAESVWSPSSNPFARPAVLQAAPLVRTTR